jgi:hypothetical protein
MKLDSRQDSKNGRTTPRVFIRYVSYGLEAFRRVNYTLRRPSGGKLSDEIIKKNDKATFLRKRRPFVSAGPDLMVFLTISSQNRFWSGF